jgi:hypothetical protein
MRRFRLNLSFVCLLLAMGCTNPDQETEFVGYEKGMLVSNFGVSNVQQGTLTFVRPNNAILNDIFKIENGRDLGMGFASMSLIGDKLYFVVGDKVEIAQSNTLKGTGSITSKVDVGQRLVSVSPTKAYLSSLGKTLGSASVAVIDIPSLTVSRNINVGNGPEAIEVIGNEAFVTLSGTSANPENRIIVINTQTDAVVRAINVGDIPKKLVTDVSGKLWVLCSGRVGASGSSTDLGTKAELIRINPISKVIEARYDIGTLQKTKPNNLAINKARNTLYFTLGNGLYAFKITDTSVQTTTPLIRKNFSCLAIDPATDNICGGYSVLTNQPGYVARYRSTGQLIDSLQVGLNPSDILFR